MQLMRGQNPRKIEVQDPLHDLDTAQGAEANRDGVRARGNLAAQDGCSEGFQLAKQFGFGQPVHLHQGNPAEQGITQGPGGAGPHEAEAMPETAAEQTQPTAFLAILEGNDRTQYSRSRLGQGGLTGFAGRHRTGDLHQMRVSRMISLMTIVR